MITHDVIAQINLLDAEVKRRMAAGEKNSALRLRLLEAARAKLKQAVDAMPSCACLYRSVARVCRMQLAHPEYDIFAEQVFRGIYTYLEYAFNMEKTRGTLVAWAQTLEMHAERLEKANDGAPTQRSAELRAMAADKRAQALAMPRHHSDDSDDDDETSVLI